MNRRALRRLHSSDAKALAEFYREPRRSNWFEEQRRLIPFLEDLIVCGANILTGRLRSNDPSFTELVLSKSESSYYYVRDSENPRLQNRLAELLDALRANCTLQRAKIDNDFVSVLSEEECGLLVSTLLQIKTFKELYFEECHMCPCNVPASALEEILRHDRLERLGLAQAKSPGDHIGWHEDRTDTSVIEFAHIFMTAGRSATPRVIEIGPVKSTAGLAALEELVRVNRSVEGLTFTCASVSSPDLQKRLKGKIAMHLCLNRAGWVRLLPLPGEEVSMQDRCEVILEACCMGSDDGTAASLGAVFVLIRDEPNVVSFWVPDMIPDKMTDWAGQSHKLPV